MKKQGNREQNEGAEGCRLDVVLQNILLRQARRERREETFVDEKPAELLKHPGMKLHSKSRFLRSNAYVLI